MNKSNMNLNFLYATLTTQPLNEAETNISNRLSLNFKDIIN